MADPGGTTATLSGGYRIETARPADVWVNIVARPLARPNEPTIITLVYGNRGNQDAVAVPLWIATDRLDTTWTPLFDVAPPPAAGGTSTGASRMPVEAVLADRVVLAFLAPVVPPGVTRSLSFEVTFTELGDFELETWTGTPLFGSPLREPGVACHGEILKFAILTVTDLTVPDECAEQVTWAITSIFIAAREAGHKLVAQGKQGEVFSARQMAWETAQAAVACLAIVLPAAKLLDLTLTIIDVSMNANEVLDSCREEQRESGTSTSGRIVGAVDPNIKVGPQGHGEECHVSIAESLTYLVHFENLPAATAPAQTVVVTDMLDAALDPGRVELGPIGFGTRVVVPPPGAREFQADVDLRPGQDLIVRVDARATAGQVDWRFESLDPTTGAAPQDPLVGFLPPNTDPPAGQGFVQLSARPRPELAHGTPIMNSGRNRLRHEPGDRHSRAAAYDRLCPPDEPGRAACPGAGRRELPRRVGGRRRGRGSRELLDQRGAGRWCLHPVDGTD